ncbi:MAG TPA: 50S ribosomal protein L35 [bacterium]|nr:50S ribosomal protein L35 [bacterium]
MKTNKAVRKRFKITKSGKVMMSSSLRRHLMTDRTSKKKRQKRRWREIDVTDAKRIKKSLPYQR